jgi:hypothetical protein
MMATTTGNVVDAVRGCEEFPSQQARPAAGSRYPCGNHCAVGAVITREKMTLKRLEEPGVGRQNPGVIH